MTDKKFETDVKESIAKQSEIMTDLVIRVTALERLLVAKKVLTEEDIVASLKDIADQLKNNIQTALEQLKKEGENVN